MYVVGKGGGGGGGGGGGVVCGELWEVLPPSEPMCCCHRQETVG